MQRLHNRRFQSKMFTKLVKVRSEILSRNYEITWEIPNVHEAYAVGKAYKGQDIIISKFVLDTFYSSINLPMKWTFTLANRPQGPTKAGHSPNFSCVIALNWELPNILEHSTADEGVCFQLQISQKNSQDLFCILGTGKYVLRPRTLITFLLDKFDITKNIPPNGQLTLQINLEHYEPPSCHLLPKIESLRSEGASKCLEDFSNLLTSGLHSDFCVKLESGVCFKLHKAILAARSSVFCGMLQSGMEECAKEEMNVADVSSQTMNVVLRFLYSGKLDEKSITVNNVEEVVYAADKYDLPLIKEAVNRLMHNFCTIENATNLWKTCKLFGLKTAEEQISLFIHRNIPEIFKVSMNIVDQQQT